MTTLFCIYHMEHLLESGCVFYKILVVRRVHPNETMHMNSWPTVQAQVLVLLSFLFLDTARVAATCWVAVQNGFA